MNTVICVRTTNCAEKNCFAGWNPPNDVADQINISAPEIKTFTRMLFGKGEKPLDHKRCMLPFFCSLEAMKVSECEWNSSQEYSADSKSHFEFDYHVVVHLPGRIYLVRFTLSTLFVLLLSNCCEQTNVFTHSFIVHVSSIYSNILAARRRVTWTTNRELNFCTSTQRSWSVLYAWSWCI